MYRESHNSENRKQNNSCKQRKENKEKEKKPFHPCRVGG
jgi:hypothetical protein